MMCIMCIMKRINFYLSETARKVVAIAAISLSACASLPNNYEITPDMKAKIDAIYAEVCACVGVQAPPPEVRIRRAWPHTKIFLSIVYTDSALMSLRHELTHYLLHVGGLDPGLNYNHVSHKFRECAPDAEMANGLYRFTSRGRW